jgi:hypothetical protein
VRTRGLTLVCFGRGMMMMMVLLLLLPVDPDRSAIIAHCVSAPPGLPVAGAWW